MHHEAKSFRRSRQIDCIRLGSTKQQQCAIGRGPHCLGSMRGRKADNLRKCISVGMTKRESDADRKGAIARRMKTDHLGRRTFCRCRTSHDPSVGGRKKCVDPLGLKKVGNARSRPACRNDSQQGKNRINGILRRD